MPRSGKPTALRRSLLIGAAASAVALPRFAMGQAKEKIRIGVPTKTYWPTIVSETALRQKLFGKEGVDAELTVYRSGAEGFEALAAGAADLILNSSSSVAAGLKKGVNARCVANGSNGYYGWHLVVKPDSKITKVAELAGKKVGITSAGSGSDILALWTVNALKVNFTRVPLGGGGLVPNLFSGNIDATVLYSPLTFKVFQSKEARSILDYGAEVPAHSAASWIATDKYIKAHPQALQKALNALYGGVAFLDDPANGTASDKLIAEIDEIPEPIAAIELEQNIRHLSKDGLFKKEWMERALDMAKLIGMTDLAPVEDMYIETFKPVPTKA